MCGLFLKRNKIFVNNTNNNNSSSSNNTHPRNVRITAVCCIILQPTTDLLVPDVNLGYSQQIGEANVFLSVVLCMSLLGLRWLVGFI